jgi:hypothetical protein
MNIFYGGISGCAPVVAEADLGLLRALYAGDSSTHHLLKARFEKRQSLSGGETHKKKIEETADTTRFEEEDEEEQEMQARTNSRLLSSCHRASSPVCPPRFDVRHRSM